MNDKLIALLESVKSALYNVPFVGKKYDQQHAHTQLGAVVEINEYLKELEELGKNKKKKPKRILQLSAKCNDLLSLTLNDGSEKLREYTGYVPAWMPTLDVDGFVDPDYVGLEIDIDTGVILNWKKPRKKDLDASFRK